MGWWLDAGSVKTTLKLRDTFTISTFIETGCFRGINVKFWSYYFPLVIGIEKSPEYAQITAMRVASRTNVQIIHQSSPDYLNWYADLYRIWAKKMNLPPVALFYLDAHFYDPTVPPEKMWVVKEELQALRDFPNCIILIHDFDCNNLGHLTYDGQPLNMELVREDLLAINPDFHFYGNTREGCEIHTAESIIGVEGLELDEDTLETIKYHKTPRLKYRGILYATPKPLDLFQFPTLIAIHP